MIDNCIFCWHRCCVIESVGGRLGRIRDAFFVLKHYFFKHLLFFLCDMKTRIFVFAENCLLPFAVYASTAISFFMEIICHI